MIRCTQTFQEENEQQITTIPLSVFIPSTTTILPRQLPSPTNSSSRSTVVRSPSSSDVDSPNEQILIKTLIPQEQLQQTLETNQQQSNIEKEDYYYNEKSSSQKG